MPLQRSSTYSLSRLASRDDAAKRLKCRVGYKQEGSACKPIKTATKSNELPNRDLPNSGASLVLSALQNAPEIYGDLKTASGKVKVDHLEKIPAGTEPSQRLIDKAEKNFERGELIRKGFDPTGTGNYALHYGIYSGKGKIIEVDGNPVNGYKIKESDLYKKEFIPTTEYEKVPDIPRGKNTPEAKQKALSLAKSMVGTPFVYDLTESNCESFARAIYYGKAETKQGSALGDFTKQIIKNLFLQSPKNKNGLNAQEMNNIFRAKGYDPAVSKSIFRDSRRDSRVDAIAPNKIWDEIKSPEEFDAEVNKISSGYNGASKQIIEIEMYKLYLIALFGLLSSSSAGAKRSDAVRKLKCKPGFKQQGAVCKPIKEGTGSSTSQTSSSGSDISSTLKVLPVGLAAGAILGGIGAAGSIIGADVKNVSVTKDDLSHLEMAPLGKDFNKEAIAAEYDKKFQKGDLIRSAFPLEFDKSKYAYHYAIYAGNGEVIESAPDKAGGAGILKQFAHDPNAKSQTTKYEKVELPPDDGKRPIKSKEHTLKLAESMVGTPFKWNVIESNCESFARTVAYGNIKGAQSEKVSGFGIKAVTSLIDIVDKVALGGVINRGYHSDDIKKILEQNNYNPELVAAAFKPKQEERRKEIEAKTKKDSTTSDTRLPDSYDLVDPKEFTNLVNKTSENFNGLSKRLLEESMFKTYLAALFTSASKLPKKAVKQDSLGQVLNTTPQQKMMKAVITIIQKTFGGISSIARFNRDSKGLITVYFHPLSDPRSLIKFDIGNSIKYKDVTNQRGDSLISEPQSKYVTAYLSAQVRLDRSGQQKKCVKGIPCKGECIPRSSTCEVDIDKVVDAPTLQNLDPIRESTVSAPTRDEDIYALMSIRDLKEEARKKGVMRYSYMTREQLQSAIKVHDSDPLHQEVIRKSLQRQKDIATLKVVKSTEIGRAIGAVNPALGRQFNLLSAIGRKYEKNPTEALIYAVPALIGTTKVAMVLLQKQRLSNIKESAGAAVNEAEKYRKDIDEESNPEGVNFYVGSYGRGSKDLYDKVANSPLATDEDSNWIKNKTENFGIDRERENVPSQGVGDNITTGYSVVVNNTFKRGKNKEAVELAAKLYAQGTTWRKDPNGVLSMPPIQIVAAEDGGVIARDAIEILQQMPKDPSTKMTGKAIADRIKLVTLGTPYFGESKVDIPEVNLVGDGDPWGSLPFNKGAQTKRVTGVGGASQNNYTDSASAVNAIFKNMRSGVDTRVLIEKKSGEEAEKARKKASNEQARDQDAAREAVAKAERDRVKAEKQLNLDKLIRDELKTKAGDSVQELDRLMKDSKAYAKAKKKVLTKIKDERDAAEFAKRSGAA